MTEINDLVAELADDVYLRGISPSQPFKPMTKNNNEFHSEELSTEQLQRISGSRDFYFTKLVPIHTHGPHPDGSKPAECYETVIEGTLSAREIGHTRTRYLNTQLSNSMISMRNSGARV